MEAPEDVQGTDCGQVSQDNNSFGTGGTCLRTYGPATTRRGTPVDVVVSLCVNPLEGAPVRLDFSGGQEHEMLVRDSTGTGTSPTFTGPVRWRWSRTVTFTQGAHQRSVAPDRCLRWTTRWDGRDNDGNLLPPGTYDLELKITEGSGSYNGSVGQRLTVEG